MKKTTVPSRQKRLRLNIVAAAVAVCGAAASVPASAGLLIQLPAQPSSQEASFSQSRIIEIERPRKALDLNSRLTANINQEGNPPIELPPIRGMGVDVTLSDALKQIIPGGWKVFTEGEVPEDTLVTWQGNRTWPMALNTVLIPSSLRAVIDWSRNEVTLSSIKPHKPLPQPTFASGAPIKHAAPAPAPQVAHPAHQGIAPTTAQAQAVPAAPIQPTSSAPVVAAAPAPSPAPAPVVNVINQIDESRIATMVAEKLQKSGAAQTASVAQLATRPASPELPAGTPAQAAAPVPVGALVKVEPAAPHQAAAAENISAPTTVDTKPAASKAQWRLSKDKFLRENLRDWAAAEGWELQWDAVVGDRVINYPVNADATLEGDLIGAGGVMDRVISKFERADEPLGVRFYRGNKVVVVFLYSANTSTFTKQSSQNAE